MEPIAFCALVCYCYLTCNATPGHCFLQCPVLDANFLAGPFATTTNAQPLLQRPFCYLGLRGGCFSFCTCGFPFTPGILGCHIESKVKQQKDKRQTGPTQTQNWKELWIKGLVLMGPVACLCDQISMCDMHVSHSLEPRWLQRFCCLLLPASCILLPASCLLIITILFQLYYFNYIILAMLF